MTRENLEIKPCVDSRSAIEKEVDELFSQVGFAAVPILTAAAMSVSFFLAIIITVVAKWIWTGTPF